MVSAEILTLILLLRLKCKRAAKQKAKEEAAQQQAREQYFHSSKAAEAEQDRLPGEEEEDAEIGRPGSSTVHPAMRTNAREAPPPYLKDVPSYDEHFSHSKQDESLPNAGEVTHGPARTVKQRMKRLERESSRNGSYPTVLPSRGWI